MSLSLLLLANCVCEFLSVLRAVMTATLTVRETFRFYAGLKMPAGTTAEQREARVNEVIELLQLEKAADTLVGNEMIRGISGGEKRRVTIGVELLIDPSEFPIPLHGYAGIRGSVFTTSLSFITFPRCLFMCAMATSQQPLSSWTSQHRDWTAVLLWPSWNYCSLWR